MAVTQITGRQTGSNTIPLGDLVNATAARIVAAAAAGAWSEKTISEVLDLLSSTQGIIPYRDGSAWAALAAGTSGQFLKTQGSGANPAWAWGHLAQPPVFGEYTTNATLTTTIPYDDTVPQSSEGTEIISVNITPKSASNRVVSLFLGSVVSVGTASVATACLFKDSDASALRSGVAQMFADGAPSLVGFMHNHVPATTSQVAYKVRAGGDQTGGIRFNGTNTARLFGGTLAAVLMVMEMTP